MVAFSRSLAIFVLPALTSSVAAAGLIHAEGPNWTWDVCDSKFLYPLQVVSYQVTPETPTIGESLTIVAGFNSSVEIAEGASISSEVRVNGHKPLPLTYDLCNAEQVGYTSNFTCPAGPGRFTVSVTIPFAIPVHGHLETTTTTNNADSSTLLCSKFSLNV